MRVPAVTVLMTAYNACPYLTEALDSVLGQSSPDLELLVIDDCSTDETPAVLSARGDPRLRVHRNPVNLGQTASLNIGLRLAQTRLVARLDADDVASVNWVGRLREAMGTYPGLAVIGSAATITDGVGRPTSVLRKPTDAAVVPAYCLYDTPIIHGSVLLDRDAILAVGGYDEAFRICQDYELWSALVRKGHRLQSVAQALVRIRTHGESVSSQSRDRLLTESATTLKSNIETLTTRTVSLEEAKLLRRLFLWPEELRQEQFRTGVRLFTDVFRCLRARGRSGTPAPPVGEWLVKPFAKAMGSLMATGQPQAARLLATHFLAGHGARPEILALWAASFLTSNPRAVFDWWRRTVARVSAQSPPPAR